MTDKSTPEDIEKNEKKVKTRMMCRGFEETIEVQVDSPTACKETLLAIAASKDLTIKSNNIKNAYPQGEEIERPMYMEPPPELKKPDKLLEVKKSLCGMNNAGRKWYFKVAKVLMRLGCMMSRYNHCLFMYKVNGKLAGILLLFLRTSSMLAPASLSRRSWTK